jgi:stearoyl-CoA desaturase (delta-9 desaturase)
MVALPSNNEQLAPEQLPEEPDAMGPVHKVLNVVIIVVPFIGLIVALVLLWNDFVGWTNLAMLAVGYFLTGFGVTVGFHRLLTHRSFKTWPVVRYVLAVLGSLAIEGPVISWVADHRKHHQFSDKEGDPHSPHVGHGEGVLAVVRGLAHAHVGWMFNSEGRANQRRYAPDLLADRGLRIITKLFPLYIVASFLIPFAIGYAITGRFGGAMLALLWGGLVRIFLLHHVTFSINSICHFWGKRRFRVTDESRNVAWLAILSMGEAWHHNHHAFPSSAYHGLKRWEIDPSGLLISGLEKLGLAWDVTRIPPERQAAKEIHAVS